MMPSSVHLRVPMIPDVDSSNVVPERLKGGIIGSPRPVSEWRLLSPTEAAPGCPALARWSGHPAYYPSSSLRHRGGCRQRHVSRPGDREISVDGADSVTFS
eukprot:84710-Hanusia_phi.AAC.2